MVNPSRGVEGARLIAANMKHPVYPQVKTEVVSRDRLSDEEWTVVGR